MNGLEQLFERLRQTLPELELRREEPMSAHTSFRVGGPAALMALPTDEAQLVSAVKLSRQQGHEPLTVGLGSNLLVDDRGLDRFVIKTAPQMCACTVEGTKLNVRAGTSLAQAAKTAADHSLTGLEFAHGIPGSLGGAVVMNAGAYGGEMQQVVRSVRVLNRDGSIETLPSEQCGFAYRSSAFSDGRMILAAQLELQPGEEAEIRARMAQLMRQRREKQPLEWPSAGSTFKRPEGYFAAALIDQCGLKGLRVGGAQVSEKHAGFVVNTGAATCRDILTLMDEIRSRVLRETGVELEAEVRYLGPSTDAV